MTVTYDPIATFTVTGIPNTIAFTSIPSTFTDLVLVASARGNFSDALSIMRIRFNSDSGSNYSMTQLFGNGSTASSGRVSNQTSFGLEYITGNLGAANVFSPVIINIQSYSNTTTNKTLLARTSDAAIRAVAQVGLYRSTSAITRIDLDEVLGTNYAIGSTFTLYGIKAE